MLRSYLCSDGQSFQCETHGRQRVYRLYPELTFDDPIYDAHIHVVDTESLDMLVDIQKDFGVTEALLICHSLSAKKYAEKRFPGRFIFAKYFSGSMRFGGGQTQQFGRLKVATIQ